MAASSCSSDKNFDGASSNSGITKVPIPGSTPVANGPFDRVYLDNSTVVVSAPTVKSGESITLTLELKDGGGNPIGVGGQTVFFYYGGGTSTGKIRQARDPDVKAVYTATFTGLVSGTATQISASVNGNLLNTAKPTVTVTPGDPDATQSTLAVTPSTTVVHPGSRTVTLVAKDVNGNLVGTGGATFSFNHIGGTSTGTFSALNDLGNGTYTATFNTTAAGTPTRVRGVINGQTLTQEVTVDVN
ncbi:MAG: hypothetical protein JNL01_01195 [Bdellovibrionales bacterium]|nr:hypothetical protein [Bdellovibrionales bacterium]